MKILMLGQTWISPAVITDEVRIASALRRMGHDVHAYDWRHYDDLLGVQGADFVLATKQLTVRHVNEIREQLGIPVFYWCWDLMDSDEEWKKREHFWVACAADGYFGNNLVRAEEYRRDGAKFHYLPMDVGEVQLDTTALPLPLIESQYDVVFTGSYYTVGINRPALLARIRDGLGVPTRLHIFGPDPDKWAADGFTAHPPMWGAAYAKLSARTKIILSISARHDLEGVWSNRNAQIMMHGGFALAKYAPGMERTFGPDGENLVYWDTAGDCTDKARYYLGHPAERLKVALRGLKFARRFLTFEYRLGQMFTILRYEYGIG